MPGHLSPELGADRGSAPPDRAHRRSLLAPAVAAGLALAACTAPPQVVDADPASGFAVYRSGRLSPSELGSLCTAGVEEIAVLTGAGRRRECSQRSERCAGIRLVYDTAQRADEPLDSAFLAAFDHWVEEARRDGRKIAFRCFHGWHRTGRLAAYYQMKFLGMSAEQAKRAMREAGGFMWLHPELPPQVDALADFIAGRPCSTAPVYCVRPSKQGDAVDAFAPDLCSRDLAPLTR